MNADVNLSHGLAKDDPGLRAKVEDFLYLEADLLDEWRIEEWFALFAEGAMDEPVTGQLTDAVVKVLAAWDWARRPVSVVTMPSRSRPRLIGSLGQRIAEIGRLTYLGTLGYATQDGPGPRRHNSAQRLASLWHAIVVPEELRDALKASDGPVLLIDDQIDTGWTMTVASALLRDANAPAVLPLALATTTG